MDPEPERPVSPAAPRSSPSSSALSSPAAPSALRSPNFRLFWCVRVTASLSFQMLGVAIGWQMYALTGSALDLGLVGLAQFLPMVALTLVTGHVADRYDRRTVVRFTQATMGVVALLLLAGSAGGWLGRGFIFALVAVLGSARAFEMPCMTSLLPAIVPREALRQATAASSSANQTAQILGPALGGGLYAFGPATVYGFVALAVAGASLLLARLRTRPQERLATRASLGSLFSGIAFVGGTPVILGALSLDLFAVLLGGATALLPIFAGSILQTGPWGLGLLRSAPAVGALAASLVLAHRPLRAHAGATMLLGVGTFGLATVAFGLSRSLPLSMLALCVLGASDTMSVVVRQSLVQLRTPPAMLGRVSAVSSLFIGTSNQLGEFESGTTAALFGTVPAVLIGGFGTVVVAALWAVIFPSLRRLRSLDEPPPATLDEAVVAKESV